MEVTLIDCMGSDLSVVNAARVSFAKRHEELDEVSDVRLLRYLAAHGHWTPFAHPQVSFRVTANIAVARQLFRHQVGLAVNEVSRRYVSDGPTFDLPTTWRNAPPPGQNKQGSGLKNYNQEVASAIADDAIRVGERAYGLLLDMGIAPEQARLVLPMATTTQWIWTGSLYAFIRVCRERLHPDAQQETREVAQAIFADLQRHFPESMAAWSLTLPEFGGEQWNEKN